METELTVRLSNENSEKVRALQNGLNMSATQIVNTVLDRLNGFEVHQVVTFLVNIRDPEVSLPRKGKIRRVNRYVRRF